LSNDSVSFTLKHATPQNKLQKFSPDEEKASTTPSSPPATPPPIVKKGAAGSHSLFDDPLK